jgi:RNA-directed DNA polymerase
MKPVTLQKLARRCHVFCSVQTLYDLAQLTGINELQWAALAVRPGYHIFSIPKKNGTPRLIEDPDRPLKKAQQALQRFLQAVYHYERTEAAFGYLVNAVDEPSPRHLLSHASRHVGKRWLMNLDLEDFFHQIKTEAVFRIFTAKPFDMTDELADLLTRVCTHNGRLPMGAPTSPILSNFATRTLDADLLGFSKLHEVLYTRYADDLTFSSAQEISPDFVRQTRNLINNHGYAIRESKFKLRSPDEAREVTGLIVDENGVHLPDDFIPKMEKEIERLSHLTAVQTAMDHHDSAWAADYEAAVKGKLSFMNMILGKEHTEYRRLYGAFQNAIQPPDDFEAVSWLHFNYI